MEKKFRVVILAAGKGKRMKSDVPKALTMVGGKPILQHIIENVRASGLDTKPVIVIGSEGQRICDAFNGGCEYAVQKKQLGTGDALRSAKHVVEKADAVIVLYGDHPFVSAKTIQKLASRHLERKNIITMMTAIVPSFNGWYRAFAHWGRVLRGKNSHIMGIQEYKDANDDQKNIHELNPALFCFDGKWLWENIDKLSNKNAQEEYYLTDLVARAVEQGEKLSSISVAPEEVIGINTQEEREIAEELLAKTR